MNVEKQIFVVGGCNSGLRLAEVIWATALALREPRLRMATLAAGFSRWVNTLPQILDDASEIDLAKVFRDNTGRIYRV